MKIFRALLVVWLVASPVMAAEDAREAPPTPSSQEAVQETKEDTSEAFGQESVDFTWLFLKMIFAMVVVIALAVVGLRYILPRLTMPRQLKGSSNIQVLERVPLDSKKGLYLLQVEGRRFLIAASEHSVGLISELDPHHESET